MSNQFARPISAPPQGALFAPIPAACARAGIGRTTVYRLIGEGRIVALKVGRRTLVDLASLDRFLESAPRLGA